MKKIVILFFVTLFVFNIQINAQCNGAGKTPLNYKNEKIGMIIYSNDPETLWNAFRLANFSAGKGDTVLIFLLGKGVEAINMSSKEFDVKQQMDDFANSGGKVLACGTCMNSRKMEGTKNCPISSMSDLYDIIKTCSKVLTF